MNGQTLEGGGRQQKAVVETPCKAYAEYLIAGDRISPGCRTLDPEQQTAFCNVIVATTS